MSKHTPGPWNGDVAISICGAYEAGLNIGFLMTSDRSRREEGEANAKLIVTAPEILADLELAAETLRRYETLHWEKGTPESDEKAKANAELAERFEATIAKAKGGR